MDIERARKNFELRGFEFSFFKSGADAVGYLKEQIQNSSVGIGGSMTAQELGLYDVLKENNAVYWHWIEPGAETISKANSAPVYITGANALSETGEVLNIDGRGNRLAAQVYGNKKLYIIAGTNKLCPDFDSALCRARNTACVKNCTRFNTKTPCQLDGQCHDCRSKERLCNALLVLWAPMTGMEAEIILIDENLGF